MTLWTYSDAEKATGGKAQQSWQAARVEIDSRRVQKGDLFVAIAGERFDGHEFVKDALAAGAAAAVVSKIPQGVAANAPLLVVQDTLKALEDLGMFARARTKAKIIGVTGSVGKTSAKEMLKLALSPHGKVFATSGNFNNHIGTPLNLANLSADIPFAVFEMGMNHAGEISHLTRMVKPHLAIITNVEAVHLEFFDSLEAIARAKSEIFDGLENGGTVILNADSPHFTLMRNEANSRGIERMVSFGERAGADFRLLSYSATKTGSEIKASIWGKDVSYTLGAVGKHWGIMSVMTLAAIHALDLDDAKTCKVLASFSEVAGRGRVTPLVVSGGEALVIDDSYNASPAAMKAAFVKTAEVWEAAGKQGRKLAALGDMLELGGSSAALHAELASDLSAQAFDKIFTAGALMKYLHDALPANMRGVHVAKASELLPLIQNELRAGDVLLLKGSHGSKLYEVAECLLETTLHAKEKMHAV